MPWNEVLRKQERQFESAVDSQCVVHTNMNPSSPIPIVRIHSFPTHRHVQPLCMHRQQQQKKKKRRKKKRNSMSINKDTLCSQSDGSGYKNECGVKEKKKGNQSNKKTLDPGMYRETEKSKRHTVSDENVLFSDRSTLNLHASKCINESRTTDKRFFHALDINSKLLPCIRSPRIYLSRNDYFHHHHQSHREKRKYSYKQINHMKRILVMR